MTILDGMERIFYNEIKNKVRDKENEIKERITLKIEI